MDSSLPQCCKNVWVSLTGTSLLKSREYIGSILKTNAPKLINGLLYYKSCKVKDVAEVKHILTANQIDEVSPEFLYKLSTLLDVEPLQSFELFLSFLLHEYKGTPKSIKNYFNSEKSIQSLLNSLWDYYYSERLFALFSLKLILSNWPDTSIHPYQQLFQDFLSAAGIKETILRQLLAQLKISISCEFPHRGTANEGMYYKWSEINVKEQMEILQLILLYFSKIQPNVDTILELMELFRCHGFGARPLVDRSLHLSKNVIIESYLKFNGFLETLVIVECLRLESFCTSMNDDNKDHHLLKEPSKFKQLNDLIESLPASLQPHSVLFLCWTVIRSYSELPEIVYSQSVLKHMGTVSLNLDVFNYIRNSLNSTFFENLKGTVVECVLKSIISALFSSLFSIFGLTLAESSMDSVYEISKRIMDDELVAYKVLDQSEENGLQLLFQKSYENFPQNITHFLELCLSLTQVNTSDTVVSELLTISLFNEWVDVQQLNVESSEKPGTLMLRNDKFLYNDQKLVIRKKTNAKLKNRKDQSSVFFVEWENVSINGFLVLAHVFEERLQIIRKGYYSSITEEALNELSLITDLVTKLIEIDANNYRHVSSIVQHCFDGFRVFTRFPQIPRKLLVSFLELFSLLSSNEEHLSTIWEIINERGFFPYMVGLTKDKTVIINGQDTSASKVGEIIAFEECVVGEYQLCCAYLKLLCCSCSTKSDYLLPALIHVLTEIFPSFHRWHYKRSSDVQDIGHLCLELFQNILCFDTEDKKWIEIVDVCKTSLLNNAAGQTLLELIISGEAVVKQVVECLGSDIALVEHNQIVMVRQSLSVLNRLLLLQEKEKSVKFVASAVEQSLFSTNTAKPNMILVLSHFVFQNYDSRLATLAATLMKRLSKHFPMSLLACLGSEAESVKSHFLFKLEAITQDLRLKVSLLDFLSSCIKHQPGLIEMFLNIDTTSETSNETSSCLKTVLEILEEKMTQKYNCPDELHCAAVKFLYTFWLQSHLLAISSLKKSSDLWKLISFPFTGTVGKFDDKVCGYIWRILAREIFFIKVLENGEFVTSFTSMLNTLKEKNCLEQMSNQIFQCCTRQADNTTNACFLLASWRDFLLSLSKFSPFEVSDEVKQKIVGDIVASLFAQLNFKEKPHHAMLMHLSDILIFVLKKWQKHSIRSLDDWIQIKTDILYAVHDQKECLTVGFHISINTVMCLTFKLCSESESWTREKLKDCFLPLCGLFKYSLRILEKQMSLGKCDNELKLMMSCITSFQHLFTILPDVMVLSPLFRSNLLIESLANLLCTLIRADVGLHLAEGIISTFVLLSSTTAMADLLQLTKVSEDISLALQNSYKTSNPKTPHSDFSWLSLFRLTLKLITSMLLTLRHHYAEVAIQFVVTHLHVFERCFVEVRQNPSLEAVKIVNDMLLFLCVLVDLRVVWITKHNNSFEKLSLEISKTCHSVISFLIRPHLLHYVLTHPSTSRNLTSAAASQLTVAFPSKNETADQQKSQLLKRSVSLETDSQSELNPDIQHFFLQLLSFTLKYMQALAPSIDDVQYRKQDTETMQLHPSFSTPNVDPDNVTSFGSLLYCLSFCVRFIQKIEKESSSETSNEVNIMKNRLPFILETSLSLLVTNAILAQSCQSLKERERQMIRRELKNELNSILISRQPKRNFSGSSITSTPRSPVNSLFDRPFVRHLLEIIEKE